MCPDIDKFDELIGIVRELCEDDTEVSRHIDTSISNIFSFERMISKLGIPGIFLKNTNTRLHSRLNIRIEFFIMLLKSLCIENLHIMHQVKQIVTLYQKMVHTSHQCEYLI